MKAGCKRGRGLQKLFLRSSLGWLVMRVAITPNQGMQKTIMEICHYHAAQIELPMLTSVAG